MPVNYAVAQTALNRLQVSLGNSAITPASGNSVDGVGSAGLLVIGTSALNGGTGVLASITLSFPSFTYASRTATLAGTPLQASATATGTAALAELRDHNNVSIITGLTVGTTGTDIIISNTSISTGATVTVTSGSITA